MRRDISYRRQIVGDVVPTIIQSALQIELEIEPDTLNTANSNDSKNSEAPQLSNKALFHRHGLNHWCNVPVFFADLRYRPLDGLLHCSTELLEYVITQQEAQCNQQGFTNVSSLHGYSS